jgi:hypothetical protein
LLCTAASSESTREAYATLGFSDPSNPALDLTEEPGLLALDALAEFISINAPVP